jgi:hypothetical protein
LLLLFWIPMLKVVLWTFFLSLLSNTLVAIWGLLIMNTSAIHRLSVAWMAIVWWLCLDYGWRGSSVYLWLQLHEHL